MRYSRPSMAHPELDQLLNSVLEFAKEMLRKHGEFFPFGSSMNLAGKVTMDGAHTGDEHPPSQELIDLLAQSYAQRAVTGELRAAAICADVRVVRPGKADKTDAISVGLEHQSGEAFTVFLPYQKKRFGRIRYQELFASARATQFFRKSGSAKERNPGQQPLRQLFGVFFSAVGERRSCVLLSGPRYSRTNALSV
jgi:hypothetical protein